jgi:hypothetical protein
MSRIEFRLSMPSTGNASSSSWGKDRDYVIVRTLPAAQADAVLNGTTRQSWFHRWDDGWTALVTGRLMKTGERRPKSDGFAGYDWMVDNIIRHGSTSDRVPS